MIKRLFDILLSLCLLAILVIPMIIIAVIVRLTSKGPAIHWSKRVGRNNKIFLMPKYRSMYTEAPQVATHLLQDSSKFITPVGQFLRKTSLDEIPQLFSVIRGDMSLVGPRPALFNQDDLVQLRTKKNVHTLRPGVTGWAQINGRDELPISVKTELDEYYLNHQSIFFDIKILFLTVFKVLKADGIQH
jgi:O-antigen biosynthesis protein WbqP